MYREKNTFSFYRIYTGKIRAKGERHLPGELLRYLYFCLKFTFSSLFLFNIKL